MPGRLGGPAPRASWQWTSGLNANAKRSMPVNLQPARVTGSLKLCQLGPACQDSEIEGVHLSHVASKVKEVAQRTLAYDTQARPAFEQAMIRLAPGATRSPARH